MIPLENINNAVAQEFDVSVSDIRGTCRSRQIAWARHSVWWIARELNQTSTGLLGRLYNRDHTAILHGVKNIDRLVRLQDRHGLATVDLRDRLLTMEYGPPWPTDAKADRVLWSREYA